MLPKKLIVTFLFLIFLICLRTIQVVKRRSYNELQKINDQGHETLLAQVLKPPQIKGGWQKLEVGNIWRLSKTTNRGKRIEGKILVKIRRYPQYQYGDWLKMEGEPKTPPVFKGFNYRKYLGISEIYSLMDFPKIKKVKSGGSLVLRSIFNLRERMMNKINRLLPEPHASLLAGIVLGQPGEYTEEFYQKLQRAGVLHVIVASGFNINAVISLFLIFAPLLGRKTTVLLSLPGIFIYSLMVGLDSSVLRAAIMGGAALLANILGRQRHSLLWLLISAYILLFLNPFLIKSISFQLSFLATLALLVLERRIRSYFFWIPDFFRESFTTTLAIMIFTLPVTWLNFREISLISPVVNSLILGTIPWIMYLGTAVLFLTFLLFPLAWVLSCFLWLFLEYFVVVVRMLG